MHLVLMMLQRRIRHRANTARIVGSQLGMFWRQLSPSTIVSILISECTSARDSHTVALTVPTTGQVPSTRPPLESALFIAGQSVASRFVSSLGIEAEEGWEWM